MRFPGRGASRLLKALAGTPRRWRKHWLKRSTGGSSSASDLAAALRRNVNPGADFEADESSDVSELASAARTIAFYLPQFYAFEENNRWWGEGFTEWRNVARGAPRFKGHYQPRIPRDLGFYDLGDDDTIREQCRLAARAGIEAFCFYYYWFDGKRLMDKPLDRFAELDVDQSFCIMWANENWTRTWDGFDSEVLIEQNYREEDEAAFIADTGQYMAHERYVRVAGRPLFILYRPGLLPNAKATLARWRQRWAAYLGVEPWILMVQGFDDLDPREYGLDGAVEFPPHKLCAGLEDINSRLEFFDENFSGHVRDYEAVIDASLGEPVAEFPLIKTVSPHWDNDARREGRGLCLHGSTPENYERWLRGAIAHARRHPFEGESLVFINAWNEWAEGAYLEPDVHYGHAYLNATRRALYDHVPETLTHTVSSPGKDARPSLANGQPLLLVGHDAHPHGAQMLLLNLARLFTRRFGIDTRILLLEGGRLFDDYQSIAPTTLLSELPQGNPGDWAREQGIAAAICNTTVTGRALEHIAQAGIPTLSLVHELPRLIADYGLESAAVSIAEKANHVVFAADKVRDGFRRVIGEARSNASASAAAAPTAQRVHQRIAAKVHVSPQGTYKRIDFSDTARETVRQSLGIDADAKVVLNVGYADLRKGFDLFMHTALHCLSREDDWHFVWVGALDPDMARWIESDLRAVHGRERVHLVGYTDAVEDWYSAADVLFLTSREDPYPTVALEALEAGCPVIAYEQATGLDALMEQHGYLTPLGEFDANHATLSAALADAGDTSAEGDARRRARVAYVRECCQLDDYAFQLLEWLQPELRKVSVLVPNYNYADRLQDRLNSLFRQEAPVFEILVLDDASSDNSLAVIEQTAARARRDIDCVVNAENSGKVFRQWQRGASRARGDYLWIAEADDRALPEFLSALGRLVNKQVAYACSDSWQVDAEGAVLADSYEWYCRQSDPVLFSRTARYGGDEFVRRALAVRNTVLNVSAVLWNRAVLSEALANNDAQLDRLDVVGDWLLYIDAALQDARQVVWCHQSLNVHCRHASSVTHRLDLEQHYGEIEEIHQRLASRLGLDVACREAIADYQKEIRMQFGLSDRKEAA